MSVVDEIALAEEEDNDAATATKEEEEMWRTELERWVGSAANNPERSMEAAAEAAKIAERGMKEAAE